MRSRITTDGYLLFLSILLLLLIRSGDCPASTSAQNAVAIKGYDTVAYFNAGKAMKGSASFTFPWHDMTWYFSTKRTGTCSRQARKGTPRSMTGIAPGQ